MLKLALLSFLLIHYGQSKPIWLTFRNNSLHKVSNIILEKGKPIQVPQNYTQVQLNGLEGTIYSDSLSQLSQVTDLLILNAKIEKIESGAICSNPALRKFQINLRRTTEPLAFTKDMFKNCENLKELSLEGDRVHSDIDTRGLDNLPNLNNLHLAQLNINHLRQDYFKNMKSLVYLTIGRCGVETIDPGVFDELKSVKELGIYSNNVSHLPPHLFKNMAKLEKLFLFDNKISDLTWDEFDGLSSLTELNIGRNNISSFNVDKIVRYMPNLKSFGFDFNSLECKKRLASINELSSKLNHTIDFFSMPDKLHRHLQNPALESCED